MPNTTAATAVMKTVTGRRMEASTSFIACCLARSVAQPPTLALPHALQALFDLFVTEASLAHETLDALDLGGIVEVEITKSSTSPRRTEATWTGSARARSGRTRSAHSRALGPGASLFGRLFGRLFARRSAGWPSSARPLTCRTIVGRGLGDPLTGDLESVQDLDRRAVAQAVLADDDHRLSLLEAAADLQQVVVLEPELDLASLGGAVDRHEHRVPEAVEGQG